MILLKKNKPHPDFQTERPGFLKSDQYLGFLPVNSLTCTDLLVVPSHFYFPLIVKALRDFFIQ